MERTAEHQAWGDTVQPNSSQQSGIFIMTSERAWIKPQTSEKGNNSTRLEEKMG